MVIKAPQILDKVLSLNVPLKCYLKAKGFILLVSYFKQILLVSFIYSTSLPFSLHLSPAFPSAMY